MGVRLALLSHLLYFPSASSSYYTYLPTTATEVFPPIYERGQPLETINNLWAQGWPIRQLTDRSTHSPISARERRDP
jgi:hypothetical protein